MEANIKERLTHLRKLQDIDSQLDEIRNLQGSLPEEAQELEDTLAGLHTRKEAITEEIDAYQREITENKNKSQEAAGKTKHYEAQQDNIRNDREYAALVEQIEYQKLEIQHLEQKNKKCYEKIEELESRSAEIEAELKEQEACLADRRQALAELEAESKQEAEKLAVARQEASKDIEERLLYSYERIRAKVRNGLAVVSVQRGACGGCFNLVPPQRQMEVREQRKLLVCEHCGRIFSDLVEEEAPPAKAEKKKRTSTRTSTTKKKATTTKKKTSTTKTKKEDQ